MILTLILAADDTDADRAMAHAPWPAVVWLDGAIPCDPKHWFAARHMSEEGTIRVVKTDRWRHDERTISALRQLAGVATLIDPAGLLGVATSTTHTSDVIAARTITDGAPVGATYRRARRRPAIERKGRAK